MMITVGMFTRTSREWSRLTGVPRTTIEYRVNAGWEPEKLFTRKEWVLKGNKRCSKCHTVKPQSEFYERSGRSGYLAHCKECIKHYGKVRYQRRISGPR
jgi:hypothetical protein